MTQCTLIAIVTAARAFNHPVIAIPRLTPILRVTPELDKLPHSPPIVNIAVMIEYLLESIPRQSGKAREREWDWHVSEATGKLSSDR